MSFVPSPFFSLRTLLLFLFAAFTSAQTFTCGIVKEKLRSDVLSDNDYANPDSELTPKGAIEEIGQVLCKQLTSTPEEEDFNFVAQVSRNALVSMKLWKPADSDFTVDCASVFFQLREQCLEGRKDGKNYATGQADLNGILFAVTLAHMDDKPNPGELYGGEDDSEDSLPGLALEPPSFYVAGFRRPQSRPQMGVAVYGIHHGNCDWLISSRGPHQDPADLSSNPRILDFMANVNDIRLGPDQKEKASYDFRDELAGFLGFSLTVPQDPDINTGTGICGILPATFYFTNLGGGLFSFSDHGQDGQLTGYCYVFPGGADKHAEDCSVNSDFLSTAEVMACYSIYGPGYCEDVGKP